MSRIISHIISREQLDLIGTLREVLANYKKIELLIQIGEYKAGSDKKADFALKYHAKVLQFLKQAVDEKVSFEDTLKKLKVLFI